MQTGPPAPQTLMEGQRVGPAPVTAGAGNEDEGLLSTVSVTSKNLHSKWLVQVAREHVFRGEAPGEREHMMTWRSSAGRCPPISFTKLLEASHAVPILQSKKRGLQWTTSPKARQLQCEGTRHKLQD